MAESKREQVIIQCLEDWAFLTEPGTALGIAGDGDSVPRLPRTYTVTVREIERLVRKLRDSHDLVTVNGIAVRDENQQRISCRRAWKHLNGWYLQAERKTFEPTNVIRPNKHRKQLQRPSRDEDGRPLRQTVVVRPKGVREPIALVGVKWMAERWALKVEPMLPDELMAAAA